MRNNLTRLTAAALSQKLQKKEISAEEAAQEYLEKIGESDGAIGAYLTVTAEAALKKAREIDALRSQGHDLPPLAGVPMAYKDNMCTKGVKTTCASRILENFRPPYDAFVVKKLDAAGAVMLGKLNMDEFAMGSTTENSHYQVTHNPVDPAYVPGGSSGGSAAAVAAGEAAYALGSDTGGSIRLPAAFCGVVGVKPTYGTVSRYGLIAFASSLDQIGPLAKDVRDAALVLNAIMGHDRQDSTSIDRSYEDLTKGLEEGVRGMRIALPKEYFKEGLSPEIKQRVYAAAQTYESLGAEVREVSLPALEYALPAYYVISSAEASSNLARFDGVKYGFRAQDCTDINELYEKTRSEGFGPEVKRRIMLGTFALSSGYYDAYYKKALQVRTLVMRDFAKIFETSDVILSPVAPTIAYRIGEKTHSPLEMYMGDVYTVPVNIAGLPALSLPCGMNAQGLPIGMQLIAPAFGEAVLLRTAYAYEKTGKEEGTGK